MGIAENLEQIKLGIAGRATLVVVTKSQSVDDIKQAISLGASDIGENRVQEAAEKRAVIGNSVTWYMIGHLQTNKVKQAVQIFDMIQSVDSEELAREIDKRCRAIGKVMPVLVEVNIGGEEQKYGVSPENVLAILRNISGLANIKVQGLMCMAPFVPAEQTRPYFSRMKALFEKIKKENIQNIEMKTLSMGMSSDFLVALEEGSNMVRIGSAIFARS